MIRRVILALLFAATVAFTFGGCASLSCKGDIPGTRCESVSSVYKSEVLGKKDGDLTYFDQNGIAKTSKDQKASESKKDSDKKAPGITEEADRREVRQANLVINADALPDSDVLLAPKEIVRAWIAPWESSDGYLHSGEYIFIEVPSLNKKWRVGQKEKTVKSWSRQPLIHSVTDISEKSQPEKSQKDRLPAKISTGKPLPGKINDAVNKKYYENGQKTPPREVINRRER